VRKFLKNTKPKPADTALIKTDILEIIELIKKLKNNKAPGRDGITHKVIKNLPLKMIVRLQKIFNKCLENCYFPQCWKHAIVILFEKPGTENIMPQNWRPISLLPSIGKLFERIIKNRLIKHIPFIPDFQFGFRDKHNTSQQLLRTIEFSAAALEKKKSVAVLAIDIKKAFDTVYHDGLIHKMIKYKMPDNIILIMNSFLRNRTFQVNVKGNLSSIKKIEASVPQGSVIGPVAFNIFVSDFPTWQDNNHITSQFADDTTILECAKNPNKAIENLQSKVFDIENWCTLYKIALNGSKSKLLLIRRNRKPITETIEIFDEEVERVDELKFLGVTITHNLKWERHIEKVTTKTRQVRFQLRHLLGRKSMLDLHTKRKIYCTVLRPIFSYASPAWFPNKKSLKQKLRTTQNVTLRQIVDAPRYMRTKNIRRDLKLTSATKYLKKLNFNFHKKNMQLNGPISTLYKRRINHNETKRSPISRIILQNSQLKEIHDKFLRENFLPP